jgi:hypothetical protein
MINKSLLFLNFILISNIINCFGFMEKDFKRRENFCPPCDCENGEKQVKVSGFKQFGSYCE